MRPAWPTTPSLCEGGWEIMSADLMSKPTKGTSMQQVFRSLLVLVLIVSLFSGLPVSSPQSLSPECGSGNARPRQVLERIDAEAYWDDVLTTSQVTISYFGYTATFDLQREYLNSTFEYVDEGTNQSVRYEGNDMFPYYFRGINATNGDRVFLMGHDADINLVVNKPTGMISVERAPDIEDDSSGICFAISPGPHAPDHPATILNGSVSIRPENCVRTAGIPGQDIWVGNSDDGRWVHIPGIPAREFCARNPGPICPEANEDGEICGRPIPAPCGAGFQVQADIPDCECLDIVGTGDFLTPGIATQATADPNPCGGCNASAGQSCCETTAVDRLRGQNPCCEGGTGPGELCCKDTTQDRLERKIVGGSSPCCSYDDDDCCPEPSLADRVVSLALNSDNTCESGGDDGYPCSPQCDFWLHTYGDARFCTDYHTSGGAATNNLPRWAYYMARGAGISRTVFLDSGTGVNLVHQGGYCGFYNPTTQVHTTPYALVTNACADLHPNLDAFGEYIQTHASTSSPSMYYTDGWTHMYHLFAKPAGNCAGDTIGVAYCPGHYQATDQSVTSIKDFERTTFTQNGLTMAHELGHSFWASHDPASYTPISCIGGGCGNCGSQEEPAFGPSKGQADYFWGDAACNNVVAPTSSPQTCLEFMWNKPDGLSDARLIGLFSDGTPRSAGGGNNLFFVRCEVAWKLTEDDAYHSDRCATMAMEMYVADLAHYAACQAAPQPGDAACVLM